MTRRIAALSVWAFAVWLVLTWTATAEQLIFGACLALLVAVALAPLGNVVAPWSLLRPRRAFVALRLAGTALRRILWANLVLARRIWTPSLPLSSGMIVLPTAARSDAELAATGIITSLIVDNQIVDLDRSRDELQYHAVAVPEGDRAEHVNAPIERLLVRLTR